MGEAMGRRERKKAATRQLINEAAARLFRDRGFDNVTVADVADEADVAVTTLFAYFPDGKQALVFGGGEDRGASIVQFLADRPAADGPLDTLERFIRGHGPFGGTRTAHDRELHQLIVDTPALADYARRRWIDSEHVLADALRREGTFDSAADVAALARFVLEAPGIAGAQDDPEVALQRIFAHLRRGWPSTPRR